MDQATRPKREQFIADYYNGEEIKKLLEVAKNDEIYIPILLTAYYGLRRSEVLGIKWSAIDFTENMITAERHDKQSQLSLFDLYDEAELILKERKFIWTPN